MFSANGRQPGGNHYGLTAVQHWDIADAYVGYLEAAATKYAFRWRVKGTPVLDLQKSIHYMEKLLERVQLEGRQPRHNSEGGCGVPPAALRLFYQHNIVEDIKDKLVISTIFTWVDVADLKNVILWLNEMLPQAQAMQSKQHIDNTGQRNVRGYQHHEEDDGR